MLVWSGEGVRGGEPFALRVAGRGKRSSPLPVRLTALLGDGRPVDPLATGEDPLTLLTTAPTLASSDALPLELDLVLAGASRRVDAALPYLAEAPAAAVERENASRAAGITVDLLPIDGTLVMGMENRVLVRVADAQGTGVREATVELRHPMITAGARSTTDAAGLTWFDVRADQPSLRIIAEVRAGDRHFSTDALLRPTGRLMQILPFPLAFSPQSPAVLEIRTWREVQAIHCDLLDRGVLRWAASPTTANHRGRLDLGLLPPGDHLLQCYADPMGPGEAYAARRVIVSRDTPEAALRQVALRGGELASGGLGGPGESVDTPLTGLALLTLLRPDPRPLTRWVDTRATDAQAAKDADASLRGWVLAAIAFVFLMVLALVAEAMLRHSLETRARLLALAAEMAELGATPADAEGALASLDPRRIARTRGLLLALVLFGTLAANVLGLIWLLWLTR